jgi:hypothetical protein
MIQKLSTTLGMLAMLSPLAMAQSQMMPPQGMGMNGQKPAFVSACANKKQGARCSYQDRSGATRTDSCVYSQNPHGQKELTCGKPQHPPGGPQQGMGMGRNGQKPPHVTACANKSRGARCSFQDRQGQTRSATCTSIQSPHGQELVCGSPPQRPANFGSGQQQPYTR